jgi:hypothetical protein
LQCTFCRHGSFRTKKQTEQINAANPSSHHAALSAALAGKLHGCPPQLHGTHLTTAANPWLRQAWHGVLLTGHYYPAIHREVLQHGWAGLPTCAKFTACTLKRLPMQASTCDVAACISSPLFIACFCGKLCHGQAGLALHQRKKHHISPHVFNLVVCIQCPLVDAIYLQCGIPDFTCCVCFLSHVIRIDMLFADATP